LGGPGSIASSQQDYLGFTGTSRAYDQLTTVGADLGGDLFQLRRTADVAGAGYEYRHQLGSQIADPIAASGDSADFNFKSTSGGFYSNEGYAELSVPIFSNMPGIEALEASAAGRYVNYNTFGDKFTYKLGARYTPVRDLTVRAPTRPRSARPASPSCTSGTRRPIPLRPIPAPSILPQRPLRWSLSARSLA